MSAPAAQLLPQPGDVIAGRYQVEAVLGKGGMGAVYRAIHQRSGRPVAVKWMLPGSSDEDAIERFLAEARTMARIEHPNVVSILDMGEENGAPFLVMELLRGESLRQRLNKRGRLGVAETVDLLLPALRGVAEAHHEGVVHRDLKPDNVFLCETKDGRPREAKVVDFGISKLAEHGHGPTTRTGMVVGTPTYMSPEQLNAPKVVDPRFDVYALGVVLYECLTGRLPYDSEGILALCGMIAAGRAIPPSQLVPEIPVALERVVLTAMHVRTEERYPTMDHLVTALEAVRPLLGVGAGAAVNAATPRPEQASGMVRKGAMPEVTTTPLPGYAGTTPLPGYATPDPTTTAILPDASTPDANATVILPDTSTPDADATVILPDPAPEPFVPTVQREVAPRSSSLGLVAAGCAALFLVGAVTLGAVVWMLGDEPSRRVVAPRPEAHVVAPARPEVARPQVAAPPPVQPALRYADIAADPSAHRGATLALSGLIAQRAREGILVFVGEEGCGGAHACALYVSGALPALHDGQAVRVEGRVEGTHPYRTRSGADRDVPHLAADRIEPLAAFDARAVDDSEHPERPQHEERRTVRVRPAIVPRQLVPSHTPPGRRLVVRSDEI